MRRPVRLMQRIGKLPQHRGIAVHRTNRLPPNIGEGWQAVISAENIARAVNEIEVFLVRHRPAV